MKRTPIKRKPRKKIAKKNRPSNLCDTLFSKIVRSVGHCEHCGKPELLQCAHGFSRRYRNTRWDETNAFCLCAGCHTFFTHRPLEWDEWLRERWGEVTYSTLRASAMSTEKVDVTLVLARLQARWAEIEAAA